MHSALKAKRVTSALQPRQTKMSLKDVWTVRVRRLVVAVWREDCSILSGPPPKSSCLRVRGTVRALASAERRQRRPESAISWQSSARYDGVSPCNDWKTIMASLKTTRCFTGNQCKRDRTGEMWSRRLVPVNRRAAAFWIDCRRRYKSNYSMDGQAAVNENEPSYNSSWPWTIGLCLLNTLAYSGGITMSVKTG